MWGKAVVKGETMAWIRNHGGVLLTPLQGGSTALVESERAGAMATPSGAPTGDLGERFHDPTGPVEVVPWGGRRPLVRLRVRTWAVAFRGSPA